MSDTSDFLIRWDEAENTGNQEIMLNDEFENAEMRKLFVDIVTDDLNRAMMEFSINGAIRFEDWECLHSAGLIFVPRDFYSHFKVADRTIDWLPDVVETPAGSMWQPDIDNADIACEFIFPYIEHYLYRTTQGGIVARRDVICSALEIRDLDVLARLRHPLSGVDILPESYPKIWSHLVSTADLDVDIIAARLKSVNYWRSNGGVHFHDTSRFPPVKNYFDFDDDGSYDEARKIYPHLSYHRHYIEMLRAGRMLAHPVCSRPQGDNPSDLY